MVGIQKHSVIVHHRATCGAAAEIGEASARVIYRLIDPVEKRVHCAVDVVCAAERTHHTAFAEWVALLHRQFLVCVVCSGDLRPFGNVSPITVSLIDCVQKTVYRQHRLVSEHEYIFAVYAAAGPVHQACRFKRGRVGELDANAGSHIPCAGFIFISRCRAVEREQNTQSRARRGVFSCGVDAVTAPKRIHTL